jgi:CheY-like chemotaxis protein
MKESRSVLLVEDDKDDQDTFVLALNDIKNVTLFDIVSNGKEALSKLKSSLKLPDVVFMDVQMPLMTGIECMVEMEKDPELRDVPVVILTTSREQKERALKLGAKAFINKTSNDAKLRADLRQAVEMIYGKEETLA